RWGRKETRVFISGFVGRDFRKILSVIPREELPCTVIGHHAMPRHVGNLSEKDVRALPCEWVVAVTFQVDIIEPESYETVLAGSFAAHAPLPFPKYTVLQS
ncbi:MAG TPA: hypothetical protein VGJ05_02260, partial [Fimbriiglobus sp.]